MIEALARLAGTGVAPAWCTSATGGSGHVSNSFAGRLGVADRVTFVGTVPAGAAVRAHLDAADLVVVPSRTEGLPRALIEAMARGLPAVGTTVGGIPELLADVDLVPPTTRPPSPRRSVVSSPSPDGSAPPRPAT